MLRFADITIIADNKDNLRGMMVYVSMLQKMYNILKGFNMKTTKTKSSIFVYSRYQLNANITIQMANYRNNR